MSGPKCVDIQPDPRALKREQNLRECANLRAQLKRRGDTLRELSLRLATLEAAQNITVQFDQESERVIDPLLADDKGDEAVKWLAERLHAADALVFELQALIADAVKKLQARFIAARQNCAAITAEKCNLPLEFAAVFPSDWPVAEKQRISQLLEASLMGLAEIIAPTPALDRESISQVEMAERAIAELQKRLATIRRTAWEEMNQLHARQLMDRLGQAPLRAETLQQFLCSTSKSHDPILRATDEEHIKRMAAELAATGDFQGWRGILDALESATQKGDLEEKLVALESLVIECSRRLREQRQIDAWRAQIEKLICASAHVRCAAVDEILTDLEQISRSGTAAPLDAYESQLREATSKEERRRERERRRRVVLGALTDLGYEPVEGMGVALVETGRVVVKKANDGYAVEVVANGDLSLLQAEVVRTRNAPIPFSATSDKEREEAWCADHEIVRGHLEQAGYHVGFRLRTPPGHKPVREIALETESFTDVDRRRGAARPSDSTSRAASRDEQR